MIVFKYWRTKLFKKERTMKYYQQGDTLYYPVKLPEDINPLETNVVQEGESTGHAHRLHGDGFQLYQRPSDKMKFLRVVRTTPLRHEEHKEIQLPPGEYRIGIVREYDHFSEEAKAVAD